MKGKGAISYVLAALAALLVIGASFGLTALMVYGFCWSFDLPWSWKISFGAWIAYIMFASTMRYLVKKD